MPRKPETRGPETREPESRGPKTRAPETRGPKTHGYEARGRAQDRRSTAPVAPQAEPGRVQKVMAAAGLGSRRALEDQIGEGKVMINGKPATLGQSLKPTDTLKFRDREYRVVAEDAQHRTLIYNKPEGELTTRSDPEGRPTVFDHLPEVKNARWVAVGRLDINTTGLLLLTTDGELANAMMHPSNQVDREYVCRIRGMVSDEQLEELRNGVMLDDGPARFSDVQRMDSAGGNQWFQVTILEGRNREVRRLWEALGCMVSRLKRVRYGAARLPKGLKVGRWAEGSPRDHRILREDVGLPARPGQLGLQPVHARGKPKPIGKSGWVSKGRSKDATARPVSRPSKPWPDRDQTERRHRDPANPGWKGTGQGRTRGSAERAGDRSIARPGSPAGAGRRQQGGKSGRR